MTRRDGLPIILVVCDYYLPGFESGGAMRTLVNMVDRLGDRFDFRIVTRDHDGPLDKTPYSNISAGEWNTTGKASVYYLSQDGVRPGAIRELIDSVKPDAIYVNSFFSPLTIFVLTLKRFGKVGQIPVILAPEGEFSAGALALKPLKKLLYVKAAKLLKTVRQVVWKAASENEREDILRVIGSGTDIHIAPNMPPAHVAGDRGPTKNVEKLKGQARMVFLSRFMRKKNFNWLVPHLGAINGELSIDICGPIEDEDYWAECERLCKTLPENIHIEAKGPVPHDQVSQTLAKYQFFILPTLGENFGHVFIEAFAAGCPVITSDQTPWRDLSEQGIGWDLPLDRPADWINAITACVEMENGEYQEMSARASTFAAEWLSDPAVERSNSEILQFAISRGARER